MFEPDKPRQSMEPSDLDPDDARKFIKALTHAIHERVRQMPDYQFKSPDSMVISTREKAKQHYGNTRIQFLTGIDAALREWDESGQGIKDLKEEYGGDFIRGVEVGERLAVYQGTEFDFTDTSEEDSENKFTFST